MDKKPEHSRKFASLIQRYFETSFDRFPTYASSLGLKEYHSELGSPEAKTYEKQLHLVESTLAELENLPDRAFSSNEWLDRKALLSELRRERLDLGVSKTWRTNPEAFSSTAMDSVHNLVIRNADNLKPVAAAIESRLRKIPGYLEEAVSTVKLPVPLWKKLAQESCSHVDTFFDSLLDPLSAASSTPKPQISRLIQDAKKAFKKYSSALDRKENGPETGFSVGQQNFEMLVRERLGLNYSAREVAAWGRELKAFLEAELEREAKRFGRNKKAVEIMEEARNQWKPKQDLLSLYQKTTQEIKEKFKSANAVSFPTHDKLLVTPVPDFLRHQFPTAAYSSPGPFEKVQKGIFWVNDLSLIKKTEAEKMREIRQHFGLALTCAHEAYPGHHLQFIVANQHPSKWRRLFAHSVFYEGWTLWCEQMMVDLKIEKSPYARLQQIHDALWRANRIIIDTGLHTGELDYQGAVKHLMKHVGFTRSRAAADVNWYTHSPTVPMSYLIGKYELLRLKQRLVDRQKWSLQKFNDTILSFGTIPWRWIEDVLNDQKQ